MQLSGVEAGRTRRWSQRCLKSLYSDIKERHKRYKSEGMERVGGAPEASLTPPTPVSSHNLPLSLHPLHYSCPTARAFCFLVSAYLLLPSLLCTTHHSDFALFISPPSNAFFFFSSPSLLPSLPVSCCISPTPPNSAKCSRHKSTSMW